MLWIAFNWWEIHSKEDGVAYSCSQPIRLQDFHSWQGSRPIRGPDFDHMTLVVALCHLGALGLSFCRSKTRLGEPRMTSPCIYWENLDTVFSVKSSFNDKNAVFTIPLKCQSSPYPSNSVPVYPNGYDWKLSGLLSSFFSKAFVLVFCLVLWGLCPGMAHCFREVRWLRRWRWLREGKSWIGLVCACWGWIRVLCIPLFRLWFCTLIFAKPTVTKLKYRILSL